MYIGPRALGARVYLFKMTRVAILIDGGHLRALTRLANKQYKPDYIEKVALSCVNQDETLRILYYDCAPFQGFTTLPVSGARKEYKGSDEWLKQLAAKDLFAVRRAF